MAASDLIIGILGALIIAVILIYLGDGSKPSKKIRQSIENPVTVHIEEVDQSIQEQIRQQLHPLERQSKKYQIDRLIYPFNDSYDAVFTVLIIVIVLSVIAFSFGTAIGFLTLIILGTLGFFYYAIIINPDFGKKIPLTEAEISERATREELKQKRKEDVKLKKQVQQRKRQEGVRQMREQRQRANRDRYLCVGCGTNNPKGSVYCLQCGTSI